MKTIGIIPARYASTRFPGKPLAKIKGRFLIEHVWLRAQKCRNIDRIVIATDDKRILSASKTFGAEAFLTSKNAKSGTDRIAQLIEKKLIKGDLFINIQGDEPVVSFRAIDRLVEEFKKNRFLQAGTLAFPIKDKSAVNDPNTVKVVLDKNGNALYFSRSAIPFVRDKSGRAEYLKHLGIYAFRKAFLFKYNSWPESRLEKHEKLEQLRILENGAAIKVVISDKDSIGVDVPSDIRKVEKYLRQGL